MNGKNYMPNNDKIVNDKIDHKSIIESTRTYKEAVNLLKEIRILSGINSRKLLESMNIIRLDFSYINKMIDEFADKNKLKGFKK
jgi:hypothetical protein|tara:strand:- start:745 stop:996 length:252 start_codon:yes stop_codon:yes gene_type:complete